MFIAILDFGTSAADRPRALDQLEGERPLVRSMPGNLAFRVYESREDDRTVTVVHEWTDQSSFVAYLAPTPSLGPTPYCDRWSPRGQ